MPKLSYANAGTDEYKVMMDHLLFDQLFPAADEHSKFVRDWAAGLKNTEEDPERWVFESLEILAEPQKGEMGVQKGAREHLYSSLVQMKDHFYSSLRIYTSQNAENVGNQNREEDWKTDMAFVDQLDSVVQELDAYNQSTGHSLMGTPQMRAIYGMIRGMQQVKADLDEKAFQEELDTLPTVGDELKARGDEIDQALIDQCMEDQDLGVKPGEEAEAVKTLQSQIDQLDRMISMEKEQLTEDIKSIQPPEIKNRITALQTMYALDEARLQKNLQDRTRLKTPFDKEMYTQYTDALNAAGFEEREHYKDAVKIDRLFKEAHEAFESGAQREELDEKVAAAIDGYGLSFGTRFRYDQNTEEGRAMSDEDLENLLNEADREFQKNFRALAEKNEHLKQADDIRLQTEIINQGIDKHTEPKVILEHYGEKIFPKTQELLTNLQSLEDIRKGIKENQEKAEQGLRAFKKDMGEDPDKEIERLKAQASVNSIGDLEKEAVKAKADYDQVKDNDTALYEKQKTAVTEARNKIITDITERRNALNDKKQKLENIVKAREDLTEKNRKLIGDYLDYEKRVSVAVHYEQRSDPRISQLQQSLNTMWGKVDWLTSGGNSDEFNDMRNALKAVSEDKNLTKQTLEHLKTMTETYLEKKKGFFHIESHKKRSYRLAFAKELKQLTENGIRSWDQVGKDLGKKMVLNRQLSNMRSLDDPMTNKLAVCSHEVEDETKKKFVSLAQQRQNMKESFDQFTDRIVRERSVVKEKIGMLKVPEQKAAVNQVKEPVKEGPEVKVPGALQ